MDSKAASTGTRSNPAPDPSITARLKLVTSRTPFPWAGLDPRVNDARLHTTKIGRPDLPPAARHRAWRVAMGGTVGHAEMNACVRVAVAGSVAGREVCRSISGPGLSAVFRGSVTFATVRRATLVIGAGQAGL